MKKTNLLCILIISIIIFACSEDNNTITENSENNDNLITKKVETTTNKTLNTICFATESIGFIGGGNAGVISDDAIILKTTDGGNSWSEIFSEDGYYIISITASSNNILYATTNKNFVLKTTDGGISWAKKEVSEQSFFMSDVLFANSNLGFIVGSNANEGIFLKTEDAGDNWSAVIENDTILPSNFPKAKILLNNFLSTITLTNDNTLIASGGEWNNGSIIKSDDFGRTEPVTWERVKISNELKITDINIKTNTGFAIGHNGQSSSTEKGAIFKTIDQGNTWSTISTGYDNAVYKFDVRGETICVVGSNKSNDFTNPEFIILSSDGGENWSKVSHEFIVAGWNDVCFIDDNTIMAVGAKGRILSIKIINN